MGHCCPVPTVKSFADATPLAVSFRDVSVLVHTNEPFPPNHIFAILNCTFIALCVRHSTHSDEVGFFQLINVSFYPLYLKLDWSVTYQTKDCSVVRKISRGCSKFYQAFFFSFISLVKRKFNLQSFEVL